jgi:hypothetical protein
MITKINLSIVLPQPIVHAHCLELLDKIQSELSMSCSMSQAGGYNPALQ